MPWDADRAVGRPWRAPEAPICRQGWRRSRDGIYFHIRARRIETDDYAAPSLFLGAIQHGNLHNRARQKSVKKGG
jgi:hypothetical protein